MDKSQLYKVPLKYGLAGGVLSLFIFLFLYWGGTYPLEVGTYVVNAFVMGVMLFFSVKELRDYKFNGKLEYWQGISAGLICVLLISLISSLFLIIFINYLDPELPVQHQQYMTEKVVSNKDELIESQGTEVYEQMISQTRKKASPWLIGLDDFIKKGIIGFFLTTVMALAFKRK